MNVCIVNRGSLSTSEFVLSRSIFCRILEPLSYLSEVVDKNINVISRMSDQIDDELLKTLSVIVFCKHNQDEDLVLLKKCKDLGLFTVYDIDDLIYKFTTDSMAYVHMQKSLNVKAMVQNCDCVVTSNLELDNRIRRDFDVSGTVIIPTGFNTEKYGQPLRPKNDSEVVLFTNGDNIKVNQFYNDFVKCFNAFLARHQSAEFHVFGDSEAYLGPFSRYTYLGSLAWDKHKEYLLKNSFKFGIVPLGGKEESVEHQEFSVCKTPIKFFEYGAAKIPTIFSKAKIYTDVVEDRRTGLLVDNDIKSWTEALEELHADQQLRTDIANNAFEVIKSKHHIRRTADQWMEIVSRVN